MNKSYDILVAAGDSHTAGAEMEYSYQSVCYEKAWPRHLAKILKIPKSCNLAFSGYGNAAIFRTVQSWVIENVLINKLFKPENIVFTIMWSGFDRVEIYIPENNKLVNISPSYKVGPEFTKELKERMEMRLKFEVLNHNNLTVDFINLQYVVNLERWLSSLGIENHHSNGIQGFPGSNYLPEAYLDHKLRADYNNLLELYTRRKYHHSFLNHKNVFYHYYLDHKDFKFTKFAKNQHFDEETHKDYAERMYRFWFTTEMYKEKQQQYSSNIC